MSFIFILYGKGKCQIVFQLFIFTEGTKSFDKYLDKNSISIAKYTMVNLKQYIFIHMQVKRSNLSFFYLKVMLLRDK